MTTWLDELINVVANRSFDGWQPGAPPRTPDPLDDDGWLAVVPPPPAATEPENL